MSATILVVEDEPVVGLEIRDDLIQLGYSVPEVVTSGDDVQSAMTRHHPDLVLMDIRIQGSIDGIQAASQLRKTSGVPVVFLTAYSDSATLVRAAEVLPEGYLLKPLGERELAAGVELVLLKARSPQVAEKNLRKMIPLIEALDRALVLFDPRGRWIHGNSPALKVLNRGTGDDGPDLPGLLHTSPEEFEANPGRWLGKQDTLVLEALPGVEGHPGGFLATFPDKESDLRNTSAQDVNQTLVDMLPADGLFAHRVDSSGFLLPCASGTGDFYDLFPLGPHHFLFYSLDVEGQGPLPSLLAFSLRGVIRDLAGIYVKRHEEIPSPAALVMALNDKFAPRAGGALFFSLTLGILTPRTGEFQVVRAGHTKTLWLKANGTIDWLQGEGTALGIFEDIRLESQRGRLQAGDRLIVCSDGVVETLGNRDLDSGYTVLAEVVQANAGRDLAELTRAIRARCLEAPGEHRDDMSLLALEPKLW